MDDAVVTVVQASPNAFAVAFADRMPRRDPPKPNNCSRPRAAMAWPGGSDATPTLVADPSPDRPSHPGGVGAVQYNAADVGRRCGLRRVAACASETVGGLSEALRYLYTEYLLTPMALATSWAARRIPKAPWCLR